MKKLFLLLLLTGLFIACGDNDNGKDNNGGIPLSDWKGDWNDPKDPAYRPEYNGAYFPIKGTWKLIEKNGKTYDKYYICEFYDSYYGYEWGYVNKTAEQSYCSPNWIGYAQNFIIINNLQLINIKNKSSDKRQDILYEYNVVKKEDRSILTITDRKQTYKLIEYTAEDADKDGWCEWPR